MLEEGGGLQLNRSVKFVSLKCKKICAQMRDSRLWLVFKAAAVSERALLCVAKSSTLRRLSQ